MAIYQIWESIRPQSITRFGRSANYPRGNIPDMGDLSDHCQEHDLEDQLTTNLPVNVQDIKGLPDNSEYHTGYVRSIRPQSITKFGRSAGDKPTSQYTRHERSTRPQSITKFGRSAD